MKAAAIIINISSNSESSISDNVKAAVIIIYVSSNNESNIRSVI
jgi:hypothetical protein